MILKLFADTQSYVNQRWEYWAIDPFSDRENVATLEVDVWGKKEKGIIEWKQEKRTGLEKWTKLFTWGRQIFQRPTVLSPLQFK